MDAHEQVAARVARPVLPGFEHVTSWTELIGARLDDREAADSRGELVVGDGRLVGLLCRREEGVREIRAQIGGDTQTRYQVGVLSLPAAGRAVGVRPHHELCL